jgi:copper chaperone
MEKATMIKFNVQGMTCGGCARAVTDAVQQADPAASVDVDLAGKTVSVESSADPARLKAAIEDAGYTVAA